MFLNHYKVSPFAGQTTPSFGSSPSLRPTAPGVSNKAAIVGKDSLLVHEEGRASRTAESAGVSDQAEEATLHFCTLHRGDRSKWGPTHEGSLASPPASEPQFRVQHMAVHLLNV